MNKEEKELMKSIENIRKYCNSHVCKNCPLDKNYLCEENFSSCPSDWRFKQDNIV